MLSRLKLRYIAALFCVGLLLSFQNCGQAPEPTMMNSPSAFQASLPFAYRARLDTIAYMSCSEIKANVEKRAYFSFRAGAYDNQSFRPSGVSLTEEFVNKTTYNNTEQRARALQSSVVNSGTQLNLSIRSRNNLQSPWKGNKGQWALGYEVDPFLPPLDSSEVVGQLAGTGTQGSPTYGRWINYFRGSGSKRLMEASLRQYEFENSASDLRQTLMGGGVTPGYLVVGYAPSYDPLEESLRVPASAPVNRAHGLGYEVFFEPALFYRAMSGLREVDLATGFQTNAPWDCNPAYRFQVVRPEDQAAGRVTCFARPDTYTNATQQDAILTLRRVLRPEDWYIDAINRCLIPKRTGDYCYGALNGASIQYNNFNCTVNNLTTKCPHYVSICVRR